MKCYYLWFDSAFWRNFSNWIRPPCNKPINLKPPVSFLVQSMMPHWMTSCRESEGSNPSGCGYKLPAHRQTKFAVCSQIQHFRISICDSYSDTDFAQPSSGGCDPFLHFYCESFARSFLSSLSLGFMAMVLHIKECNHGLHTQTRRHIATRMDFASDCNRSYDY